MDVIFDPSYLQCRTAVLAQHSRKIWMQLPTNLRGQKPFAILRTENQMHQDTGQGLRHAHSPFRVPHALHIARRWNKFYLEGALLCPMGLGMLVRSPLPPPPPSNTAPRGPSLRIGPGESPPASRSGGGQSRPCAPSGLLGC